MKNNDLYNRKRVIIVPFWISLGIAFVIGVVVGALLGAMITFILLEERK